MQTTRFHFRSLVWCVAALVAPSALAADSEPLVILEVTTPPQRGEIVSATPPRFVLLEDGEVFVGGTSEVASGRLEKTEVKAIEDRIDLVRKMAGLANTVELGPGGDAYRLRLPKARLDVLAKGDLSTPSPLATLLRALAAFHHPTLRRYAPPGYLLVAHEKTLPGGCRTWAFPVPLASALAGAQTVPASAASGWPTGAMPASVCDGDKRYAVTLTPLVPGVR